MKRQFISSGDNRNRAYLKDVGNLPSCFVFCTSFGCLWHKKVVRLCWLKFAPCLWFGDRSPTTFYIFLPGSPTYPRNKPQRGQDYRVA